MVLRAGVGRLERFTTNILDFAAYHLQILGSIWFGSDTLTGVNDADYLTLFPLNARLNKLTIKVDRPKLTPEDIKKLENAEATALDGKPPRHVQSGPQ